MHRQRPKRGSLGALEAHARQLVCRAVHALIGLCHPAHEVGIELGERLEPAASERIVLRIADAALGEQVGNDDGIALGCRLEELDDLGPLLSGQRACCGTRLRLRRAPAAHVALHGLARDAKLAGDAPAASSQS